MNLFLYRIGLIVAIVVLIGNVLLGQTVTTIETSGNWTVPTAVTSLKIEAWGGGGGGGASIYGAGGGGGGGAFSTITWTVIPGQIYTITIGSGGNGGTTISTTGQNGNTSTISGTAGTLNAAGGNGGAGGIGSISGFTITNQNGTGGLGASGDFNGGNGGTASATTGSGGGGAGNFAAGGAGSTSSAGIGGTGSPSQAPYTGGNGGAQRSSNGAGSAGNIPAGGGSGARSWSNVLPRNGGNGARGQIVLTYTPDACTNSVLTLTSNAGTDQQSLCSGIAISDISYAITGDGTGAAASGLPSGVNGLYDQGVFTISGTPSESGIFNYTVITSGTPTPCTEDTVTGTITIYSALGANGEESSIIDSTMVWSVPDGVDSISVEAWGGGGAGGGAELTFLGIGGGGGGGAYALKKDLSVTPYQSLDIIVAGLTSGVAAGNGPDGGHTTITGLESQIYAAGGKGGRKSIFLSPYPNGGEGGKASDSKGDCTADGQNGLNGFRVTAAIPPPIPTPVDGAGGAAGTAQGGSGGSPVGEVVGNGNPGSVPGGGGSGSRSSVTLTLNTTGGAGGNGRMVIWYQCPELTDAGEIGSEQEICYNTAPAMINEITGATVQTGAVDYKWQSSVVSASSGFVDVASATSTSFTPDSLTQSTWFRRLSKPRCNTDWPETGISNAVLITVRPEFLPGEILTAGEEICAGSDAGIIGNTTLASGGDETFTYKWQSSVLGDFTDATEIPGADESTFDPPILTATVSYRRLAKDSTCVEFTPSTGIWTVTVYPASVGGTVTGGGLVCYGVNSTLLTLTGQTGSAVNWQNSTNGTTWTDIPGTTSTGYTAENHTVDTYYRVVVKSGACPVDTSASDSIIMNTNFKISGFAKYENNPQTPLNGLKITLKKDGTPQSSQSTGLNGYYEFSGLINGNYSLEIESDHPSGQWQTWGGVNNTDALLVQRHMNNVTLLPVNPPVVRSSASVKELHPVINNADYLAIRQAAKLGWGSPVPWFDIPKWVFSATDLSSSLTAIELNCSDVAMDIRGLCSGDVNGTYVPAAGYKMALPGLELLNRGVVNIEPEMVFPVHADRKMELGAITLMMDFDLSQIDITNVSMPGSDGVQPWFDVEGSMLQIGWVSLNPVSVEEGATLLLIHARAKTVSAPIRFTLNTNPLSELADAEGNVISGAKLTMPEGGNGEMVKWRNGEMVCYPNPARTTLNLELETPASGTLSFELVNLQGVTLMKRDLGVVDAGWHNNQLDVREMAPGVYFLRANVNGNNIVKKIIITR